MSEQERVSIWRFIRGRGRRGAAILFAAIEVAILTMLPGVDFTIRIPILLTLLPIACIFGWDVWTASLLSRDLKGGEVLTASSGDEEVVYLRNSRMALLVDGFPTQLHSEWRPAPSMMIGRFGAKLSPGPDVEEVRV